MGWDPLTSSLERWFADAWSRGLHATALDLAWIVATLRHPGLTVSPGLRMLLDSAAAGAAEDPKPSEVLPDPILAAVAHELRQACERHARLHEPAAGYRPQIRRVLTDAAAWSPARSL